MNSNELRAELVRNGLSPSSFAKAIGIGKNSLYRRLNGEKQFKQNEILKAKEILNLSDSKLIEIFFGQKVA